MRREISREALGHDPWNYARMVAMKVYSVFALNDAHERLDPARWSSGAEKFLGNTFQKIDPKFPGYVLGDAAIDDSEKLHAALANTLSATGSQTRVLRALDFFEQATAPFSLNGKCPDRWWWIVPVALGASVFPWTRDGHRLLPLVILAAGYLGMTFLVGRAVGRYRLPVEFALYVSAAAGLSLPGKLRGARRS